MIRLSSLAARRAATPKPTAAPALRPHLALRVAVLDRTDGLARGRAAADAWLRPLPPSSTRL